MKKNILIAMAAILFAACGNNNETKDNNQQKKGTAPANAGIAYVELDSVLKNYVPYKEAIEAMTNERESIERTAASKQQALQNSYQQTMAQYEQQVQNGQLDPQTAQKKAVQLQNSIQSQGQSAAAAYEKQLLELQRKDSINTAAFTDSIHHFLADYNKEKGYSMILAKSGLNILYAQPGLDITNDVVTGLNKRYKKEAKK